jgi:hypothetical protein
MSGSTRKTKKQSRNNKSFEKKIRKPKPKTTKKSFPTPQAHGSKYKCDVQWISDSNSDNTSDDDNLDSLFAADSFFSADSECRKCPPGPSGPQG